MILDTNTLSAYLEADPNVLRKLPVDRLWYIPTIVLGEYRFGLLGSTNAREIEPKLALLLAVTEVLSITEETTEFYAHVRHSLKLENRSIPPNDSWIAALALQSDLPILSRDKHFDHILGITRIGW